MTTQDLMKYDPQQRPTASQTLQYPFFQVSHISRHRYPSTHLLTFNTHPNTPDRYITYFITYYTG